VKEMRVLKVILKVIVGIALIILGLLGIWTWRLDVLALIKGSAGLILILAGLICFLIAKE
jgi:hypothetical protein